MASIPSVRLRAYAVSITLFSFYFFISLARLRGGLFRIPPDPGFDLLAQARPIWRFSFFDISGSYLSITPRIIAKISSFAPTSAAAVIASSMTLLIWALTATVCFYTIKQITNRVTIAFICGLIVVLNPAAGESSIGNYGNAIWQLFIMMTLLFASEVMLKKHTTPIYVLAIIGGLSHPWAVLALLPLLGTMKNANLEGKKISKRILVVVMTTFSIQIAIFAATGSGAIRSGITYWWSNIPIFWSFNWLFPIALSAVVIIINPIVTNRESANRFIPMSIAMSSISVALVCYLQGGIADRYFVAPMTLSIIAIAVLTCQSGLKLKWFTKAIFTVSLALVCIGSIVWFRASSYLNSGPTWHSEIIRLRQECNSFNPEKAFAQLSIGVAELNCDDL